MENREQPVRPEAGGKGDILKEVKEEEKSKAKILWCETEKTVL